MITSNSLQQLQLHQKISFKVEPLFDRHLQMHMNSMINLRTLLAKTLNITVKRETGRVDLTVPCWNLTTHNTTLSTRWSLVWFRPARL